MATPAESTTIVSTTCMLPSVFTVIRESNEHIPSVCAAAGTAASRARQAIRNFFMEVSDLTIALLRDGWKRKNYGGSELAHGRGLVRADPAGNDFCAIVILTAHRTAGHATQNGDLSGMGRSVSNR